MSDGNLWTRYRRHLCACERTGICLDVSRMLFPGDFFQAMAGKLERAFQAMDELESGSLANPDEGRMVGHYWLRNPQLAPMPELAEEISTTVNRVKQFAADVHAGKIAPTKGPRFENVLVIGIGGSALGPQLVADALGTGDDPMKVYFLDNTDPDGMERVFAALGPDLGRTLCIVISKSGGTKETRNGMVEAAARYRQAGLRFESHAVAVTGRDSRLDQQARQDDWLEIFPMWDWVGGRTSVTSAVGLLPAALQGIDIVRFLAGAADMDRTTRVHQLERNPAALMALMWYHGCGGQGRKDLVIIPYKDRLALLSKYLQQLIMESLGKEVDLNGELVHQGLTVYGNKGSTDQHAYVQQLRDGVDNFFVSFIEVLRDRAGAPVEVESQATSGDFLLGFLLGTREALFEKGRQSMTITLPQVDAYTLGALIALFERTVGLYAAVVNINAYHQPGVEAGKKAAGRVIELQRMVLDALSRGPVEGMTAEELAESVGAPDEVETIYKILEHLAANPDRGVVSSGQARFEAKYSLAVQQGPGR